jgi:T4-like virus tail tube protein gp19
MGTTPPVIQTVTHISVSISISGGANVAAPDGMSQLLFSSCSPPDWSIEAPKHIFHGNDGKPESIISSVQNPSYGTMTLTQGWDPGNVLVKWMNLISDATKPIDQKKAEVIVIFMDNGGQPLFQWLGHGSLLTSLSHSPSDASSNGVLTITATLDADTWVLAGPSGSDPLQ